MDYIPPSPYERLAPLRNDRQKRLNSFSGWPVTCPISPVELSNDMFYYTGLEDKVQCTHCGGILSDWDFGDNVHLEHKRHFPDCPWIRQCQLQPALFANAGIHPPPPNPAMNTFNFANRLPSGETVSSTYVAADHINDQPGVNRPKYPEYSLETTRINSYKGWPSQIKQRPEILAKSGFFYMGQGDKCKCFYCGGILYDWEPNDDIWEEHAKWFPECPYLKLQKGDNYIQEVQRHLNAMQIEESSGASQTPIETVPKTVDEPSTSQSHPSAAAGSSTPSAASASKSNDNAKTVTSVTSLAESEQKDVKAILKENENLKKQKECKICMSDDATTVFLPCGHLVCCPGCAVSVTDCPMCRKPIEKVVRVYY